MYCEQYKKELFMGRDLKGGGVGRWNLSAEEWNLLRQICRQIRAQ